MPVPELDVHTIADQLVPVQQENAYTQRVRQAGDSANLREADVDFIGHCDFTSADIVAARVQTGNRARPTPWRFPPIRPPTLNNKLSGGLSKTEPSYR